jgi:hypothetical protein
MSELPRNARMTAAGWPDLVDELDRWQEAGRIATLWWRDDDATAPSPPLNRLLSIAGHVPLALSVIPATADPRLAQWLSGRAEPAHIAVLQHGWRHANNSAGKKSEFPIERPRDQVGHELAAGLQRLTRIFESRVLPVLVPPWNRFDDSLLPLLPGCGLHAISRANPCGTARPVPGLIEVNVHADLVAWSAGRRFIGEAAALGALVAHLQARRLGIARGEEPTGILTHHLVHEPATEAFLGRLTELTEMHAAARWLDATEVFAPAVRSPG